LRNGNMIRLELVRNDAVFETDSCSGPYGLPQSRFSPDEDEEAPAPDG